MSVSKIINFLSRELARRGSDLMSGADFSSIGIIESELDNANVTDSSARAVAWIAAVVPSADRNSVREAYGEEAEALLERLVPLQVLDNPPPYPARGGLGRMLLWTLWGRATQDADATVRAVAAALLVAEQTKVADVQDARSLRTTVETAIDNSEHTSTRERLTNLRDLLSSSGASEAVPTAPRRPRLITLSIDVVGSTAAKTRLRDPDVSDERRDELYRQFYKRFLEEEGRFYDGLFEAGTWGYGPPLDWRRLFVVKGIGDELWVTYDVSDLPEGRAENQAEIARASVRIIGAALDLVRRTMHVGGTAHDTGPNFDPASEEFVQSVHMDLPFKVTLDLIEDAIEISDIRRDYLAARAGLYLAAPKREPGSLPARRGAFGADDVEILNRLNAGNFALVGGHRVRQVYRTDLIGNDVDRFFRIAKEALPGCVMVGESLYAHLSVALHEKIVPNVQRIELLFAPNLHRPPVTTGQTLLCRTTEIPEKDLKGIGRPYTVHHLIATEDLRGIWNKATRNDLFGKTVEKLPRILLEPAAIRQSRLVGRIALVALVLTAGWKLMKSRRRSRVKGTSKDAGGMPAATMLEPRLVAQRNDRVDQRHRAAINTHIISVINCLVGSYF
jgi:hypothetical protein